MLADRSEAILSRFNLRDGQFFALYKFKNLHWMLNDEEFGYGDLIEKNIEHIKNCLEPGEVFTGYNEHHMTVWMQRESPMVRIDHTQIEYPDYIPVSKETREKIRTDNWRFQ